MTGTYVSCWAFFGILKLDSILAASVSVFLGTIQLFVDDNV